MEENSTQSPLSLLVIADDILFSIRGKEENERFHPGFSDLLKPKNGLDITVSCENFSIELKAELYSRFGVKALSQNSITDYLDSFHIIAGSYRSLKKLSKGISKNSVLLLVFNIWDVTLGADVKELKVPNQVEHVYGAIGIIPRILLLKSNPKYSDIKTIGIFFKNRNARKYYGKRAFFEDFSNVKVVPIYFNGSYPMKYDIVISRIGHFLGEHDENNQALEGYLKIVANMDKSQFIVSPKTELLLRTRKSFLRLKEQIKNNATFSCIKFLDMVYLESKEDIFNSLSNFAESDFPLLVKPNHSYSTRLAHTFRLIQNMESYLEVLQEAYEFYSSNGVMEILVQRYIEGDPNVIKVYVLGDEKCIRIQDGCSHQQVKEYCKLKGQFVDFSKLKNTSQELNPEQMKKLEPEAEILGELIKQFFDTDVFGYDLIQPQGEDIYYFIDINPFVRCKPIEDQFSIYTRLLNKKLTGQSI